MGGTDEPDDDGQLADVVDLDDYRNRKRIDWSRWARNGGVLVIKPDHDDDPA